MRSNVQLCDCEWKRQVEIFPFIRRARAISFAFPRSLSLRIFCFPLLSLSLYFACLPSPPLSISLALTLFPFLFLTRFRSLPILPPTLTPSLPLSFFLPFLPPYFVSFLPSFLLSFLAPSLPPSIFSLSLSLPSQPSSLSSSPFPHYPLIVKFVLQMLLFYPFAKFNVGRT